MSLLDIPVLLHTRRNHALEHATLHLLAEKFPHVQMGGYSIASGFFIMGDLPQDAVRDAASNALARLRSGEKDLAIHPGCGTNFAISLLAVSLPIRAVFAGEMSLQKKLRRIPDR